jgi:hypothetical protein
MDYDISHYTKEELENMLNLSSKYDALLVDSRCNMLKTKVQSNIKINENIKSKIYIFLDEVKNVLGGDEHLVNLYGTSQTITSHDLIKKGTGKKESKNYVNSYPSDVYTGILNPLERRTFTRIVNIDTKFRDNYDASLSSDCSFVLPMKFANIVSMELASFEFPTLYYLTSLSGDNYYYFTLEINNVLKYVCIPSEIHNFVDVIAYLNSYFQTIGETEPDFKTISFALTMTNPSTQSGVVQIINNPNVSEGETIGNVFNLDFSPLSQDNRPLSSNLGWLLGFRNSNYQNSNLYVSETLANFVCDKYLFLVVDEFVNNKSDIFYSCFSTSILNKNIIARITLHPNNSLDVITEPRQYFGQIDLSKMKVQLLDEYGSVIRYKNIDYSFCLKLTTIYNI